MSALGIAAELFALLAGVGATTVAHAFSKVETDGERQGARIEAQLPAWNCGACGENDCAGMARRLAEGASRLSLCPPLEREGRERIRGLLGATQARKRAVVACSGRTGAVRDRFAYSGRKDCRAAASFYGGQRGCEASCLGYGDCLETCPVGAIAIRDGIARVDAELCDGCGICVGACPNGVIRLLSDAKDWYVACNSRLSPAEKARSCDAACTACRACERISANGEFSVEGGLARALALTTGTHAEIAAACPQRIILRASPGVESRHSDEKVARKNTRSAFRKSRA